MTGGAGGAAEKARYPKNAAAARATTPPAIPALTPIPEVAGAADWVIGAPVARPVAARTSTGAPPETIRAEACAPLRAAAPVREPELDQSIGPVAAISAPRGASTVTSSRKARTASPASAKRASTFWTTQRANQASKPGGIGGIGFWSGSSVRSPSSAARTVARGMGSTQISRSSIASEPSASLQKSRPVISLKVMSPSAHTSVPGQMRPFRSVCSGAMKSGVPRGWVPVFCRLSSTSLAMPKSRILAVKGTSRRREVARKMFSGLRSRWTMPWPCACSRAWPTCESTSATSPSGRGPRRAEASASSSPRSSSMTR